MQNVGCTDADWASDAADRKSISGYSFYFQGHLFLGLLLSRNLLLYHQLKLSIML